MNMTLESEIVSEKEIITMLQENNPLAWEHLYDKYAPAMYGLVCSLTDDKLLGEQIFANSFIQLKKNGILSGTKYALSAVLLKHTYSYAMTHLKQIGINPKPSDSPNKTKILYLILTQCNVIKEAASMLTITEKEVKKRIHAEFSGFANAR